MSAEDQLAATFAAGMGTDQRAKRHFGATIVDTNFATSPKTVTVTLDFSDVECPEIPFDASYGGFDSTTGKQAVPKVGDVVRVEAVGFTHTVIGKNA